MLSDKHAVTLFESIWLYLTYIWWFFVASSSLLHVINAIERMHSHGFSHQSLRRFHAFPLLFFCNFLCALCVLQTCTLDLHKFTTCVYFKIRIIKQRAYFLFCCASIWYCLQRSFRAEQILMSDNLYVFKLGWSWSQTFKMLALLLKKQLPLQQYHSYNVAAKNKFQSFTTSLPFLTHARIFCSLQRPFHKERFPPKSLRWAYILMNLG